MASSIAKSSSSLSSPAPCSAASLAVAVGSFGRRFVYLVKLLIGTMAAPSSPTPTSPVGYLTPCLPTQSSSDCSSPRSFKYSFRWIIWVDHIGSCNYRIVVGNNYLCSYRFDYENISNFVLQDLDLGIARRRIRAKWTCRVRVLHCNVAICLEHQHRSPSTLDFVKSEYRPAS